MAFDFKAFAFQLSIQPLNTVCFVVCFHLISGGVCLYLAFKSFTFNSWTAITYKIFPLLPFPFLHFITAIRKSSVNRLPFFPFLLLWLIELLNTVLVKANCNSVLSAYLISALCPENSCIKNQSVIENYWKITCLATQTMTQFLRKTGLLCMYGWGGIFILKYGSGVMGVEKLYRNYCSNIVEKQFYS